MEKPNKENYGWHTQCGFDSEPTGRLIEGGEEAYEKAMKKWEFMQDNSVTLPQPHEVDSWLSNKFKHKRIDDEFGFTGEYRLCQKDLIDFFIDVMSGL